MEQQLMRLASGFDRGSKQQHFGHLCLQRDGPNHNYLRLVWLLQHRSCGGRIHPHLPERHVLGADSQNYFNANKRSLRLT